MAKKNAVTIMEEYTRQQRVFHLDHCDKTKTSHSGSTKNRFNRQLSARSVVEQGIPDHTWKIGTIRSLPTQTIL